MEWYGLPVVYDAARVVPGQWDCPPGQPYVVFHDPYDCLRIRYWQRLWPRLDRIFREAYRARPSSS